ncbi:MAG: glycosyltransferase [Gammaproteobacteria bacterium]|nr:glycosyltransferase [Gammaproteobacteria bacterium]
MTETQDCAPVALFVFNRPEHTRRTIQSLLENDCSAQTPLVIFSDGARSEKDVPMVESVREYIRGIDGFRDVRIVEQAENRGLAESVIAGVTEVINHHGRVIVLEDDMETSPFFLDYMNRALEKYRDNNNVYCIHGYAFPADMSDVNTETFFLGGAECWGWATWKRAWDNFCPDAMQLISVLRSQGMDKAFDYDGSFPYMRMLKRQSRGRIDSWAIRWRASAFVRQGLTLWPKVSLVRNFGMDGSGVHCDNTSFFDVALADRPVTLADIPIKINKIAFSAYGRYLKEREGSLLQQAMRFIRKRVINVISDR